MQSVLLIACVLTAAVAAATTPEGVKLDYMTCLQDEAATAGYELISAHLFVAAVADCHAQSSTQMEEFCETGSTWVSVEEVGESVVTGLQRISREHLETERAYWLRTCNIKLLWKQ